MTLSTISSYERACLVGNYHFLGNKDNIDPKIQSMGYTKAQLAMLEKQTVTKQYAVNSCGMNITGDYKQFIEPNIGYYLEAFSAYDNHGVLPYTGSFTEQPSKILDLFEIFKQMQNEEETKIRKQIERNQKRAK